MVPGGLYARLCHAFFSFCFTMSKTISVSTGPIFTIFSPNGRYLREFSSSGPVYPIPQGMLTHTKKHSGTTVPEYIRRNFRHVFQGSELKFRFNVKGCLCLRIS